MSIKKVLSEVLDSYLIESRNMFKENRLAAQLRTEFPKEIGKLLLGEGERYMVKGSPGNGNWADCPWIAVFDTLITSSAESGYYLVYIFKSDMSGVYLTLNQGVSEVVEYYKRGAKDVLVTRANDFRDRLAYEGSDFIEMDLVSRNKLPRMYEKGNILACYYDIKNLPDEPKLIEDLERFMDYYKKFVFSDSTTEVIDLDFAKTVEERKRRRLHEKFDRRGDVSLKVKKRKGYKCEACALLFTDRYGDLGDKFIEAHHLKPFASLNEGKIRLNIETDFAVLCSNCHRMIHRLEDPSDLNKLRMIVTKHILS